MCINLFWGSSIWSVWDSLLWLESFVHYIMICVYELCVFSWLAWFIRKQIRIWEENKTMNFLYVLTAHPGNIWIVSMMFDLFTVLKHFCLFDHEKSHHPIHLAIILPKPWSDSFDYISLWYTCTCQWVPNLSLINCLWRHFTCIWCKKNFWSNFESFVLLPMIIIMKIWGTCYSFVPPTNGCCMYWLYPTITFVLPS